MKTIDDKTKIMSSLNRMKGTEEIFGKSSIREDYTNSERDEIKTWVQKAKDKSEIDPEHIYKVRGDPKNGLRLVSFTRQSK